MYAGMYVFIYVCPNVIHYLIYTNYFFHTRISQISSLFFLKKVLLLGTYNAVQITGVQIIEMVQCF